MRILQVVAPAPAGGLERVVRSLSRELIQRGHVVTVAATVSPGASNHGFIRSVRDAGVPVEVIEVRPRAYVAEARHLQALMTSLGVAVVHTHGYHPDIVGGIAAWRAGIPMVSTVHGYTGGGLRNRLYEWMQKRAMRHAAAVVAVSQPLMDAMRRARVAPERLHYARNAWTSSGEPLSRAEARRVLGITPTGAAVAWIGRMSAEKAPDVFLAAVRECSQKPAVSMLGDGPERARLEAKNGDLPVSWHGVVADAERYLRGFDVLVLSSRTEGTPMVLLEAMAAGTPIVTTAVGGIPDLLDADCALLVPPDDPPALAHAIDATLRDPDAARTRARNAANRLQRDFRAATWLDTYERIYAQVIANAGR